MWKLGYIKESERLFANVMKTIQEHVMVINNKMFMKFFIKKKKENFFLLIIYTKIHIVYNIGFRR